MSVIKKVFKSIFPSKLKEKDSHKHHNNPELKLDSPSVKTSITHIK